MKKVVIIFIILSGVIGHSHGGTSVIWNNGMDGVVFNGSSEYYVDNFSLATDAVLLGVLWAGVYGYNASHEYCVPVSEDAWIRIYTEEEGHPAESPVYDAVISDVTRETAAGSTWPAFSWYVDISELYLPAGTYYISVCNINMITPDWWTSSGDVPWHWGYAQQGTGDAFVWEDNAWNSSGNDMMFQLYGQAVPEPGTLGLLALGAGALVWRRRKRGK